MNTFIQAFRGYKTKYFFDDKELSYEYADSEDSIAFKVNYREINAENSVKLTSKDPIWKFGSFPFVLLALFAIGKASLVADSVEKFLAAFFVASIWILIASIFWIKYQRSKASLTMFDSERGRLVVVHDGQEAEIINLIQKLVSSELESIENLDYKYVQ